MDNLNTNEIFEEQRQQILSIRKEINLLAQQVDYLIRNEKPLGLLDVDVLMNRTHTLYDMLCSIEFEPQDDNSEEDFDEDMVNVLATAVAAATNNTEETKEETHTEESNTTIEPTTVENLSNENQVEDEIPTEPETTEPEQPIDYSVTNEEPEQQVETIIEPEDKTEEQVEEPTGYINFDNQEIDNPYTLQENGINENPIPETDMVDGVETFVMHFDDVPTEQTQQSEDKVDNDFIYGMEQMEKEETAAEDTEEELPIEKVVSDPIFEIITPKGDSEYNEEEEKVEEQNDDMENSFVEPEAKIETIEDPKEENLFDSIDIQNTMTETSNDDVSETLGEKMISEDNSLAAKLQNRPVGDLKSAIGINDKFLFVNELFSGSMDKYNRSIENLNDIQTYNGALIYLNELKVELQWNSNNVAYKKLCELVKLKFD